MSDHRIDISACYKESEARASKLTEGIAALVIGLGEDSHTVACRLKNTRDYSYTKAWVVNVCVSRNVNEIGAVPTKSVHFFFVYR